MELPETQYARARDGTRLAYKVLGDGPVDLVYLQPWYSHIEIIWEEPRHERFLQTFASFSRLIIFDRRGSGMSDPMPIDRPPDMEARMDDARAVMDEVGSERAVIYGASESGALACLFAAAHPDRTIALVVHGSCCPRGMGARLSLGHHPRAARTARQGHRRGLGHRGVRARLVQLYGQEQFDDEMIAWEAKLGRYSMSPGAAVAYERMTYEQDVRDVLPAIHVPTLILHREQDSPEDNRYLAEHIPGAEYIALEGYEHVPYLGDQDSVTREIERFARSVRDEEAVLDRVLATVMFTDIVGSTETVARLGDQGWRDLVERHHAIVRSLLGRYRGSEVDTAGDGFFATFDGPARAVKCASAIADAVKPLGIEIRAGVHTGEVETVAGKAGGLAVVIGARIGSAAGPSQVLASQTVKDLTAGSGIGFEDSGEHELKGVPDRWRLYQVVG